MHALIPRTCECGRKRKGKAKVWRRGDDSGPGRWALRVSPVSLQEGGRGTFVTWRTEQRAVKTPDLKAAATRPQPRKRQRRALRDTCQSPQTTQCVATCPGSPRTLTRPLSTPAPLPAGGAGASVEIWTSSRHARSPPPVARLLLASGGTTAYGTVGNGRAGGSHRTQTLGSPLGDCVG